MGATSPLHIYDRASYRITVWGVLDERWSDWVDGMRIVHAVTSEGAALTVLEGEVADQSALVGVLNVMLTLSLPLVAVECLSWSDARQAIENGND